MPERPESAARVAALVGPQRAGKTSLLESLLLAAGAIPKKGRVRDGTTISDASTEARARGGSVEVTPIGADYHGARWTFLDCPGSVELASATQTAVAIADVAIVVCEPDPERAVTVAPILRWLDASSIPHLIFINKVDSASEASRIPDVMAALSAVSTRPLVARELPVVDGQRVSGLIELVRERAYRHEGEHDLPDAIATSDRASATRLRTELLERVADFDDPILETLLDDRVPEASDVYASLARDLREDRLVSVFFGSAELDLGIERLLKTLHHDTPGPDAAASRLFRSARPPSGVAVFRTVHAQHLGKQSYARVFRAPLVDGTTLAGATVNGIQRFSLAQPVRVASAEIGDVVSLGRLDPIATGDLASPSGKEAHGFLAIDPPVHALAIASIRAGDDAKLSAALAKLLDEDPALTLESRPDTQERLLHGAGEMHLELTLARLSHRFGIDVRTSPPSVPYRESIRSSTNQHGRYKHQSGGHGQFGDVLIRIEPLPRGDGFRFRDEVVGGAVPRQYFGAIEAAAIEALERGPLSFPVVDVSVTLTGGSYHSVDSSDQAFRAATRLAIVEGLPRCEPVLLEPIDELRLYAPSEYLPKLQRLVTGRRGGQILGFDQKAGWPGWDELVALVPRAETHGLIVELRSLTLGLGSFVAEHHHDREVLGREAERVVELRKRKSA